jgi:hypothetical protein
MKFTLIFIFIIFSLIILVSATRIGISPTYLNFNGSANEKICLNFSMSSDFNGNIIGETKWSLYESKNIRDYSLQAEELGIIVDFPENIKIEKSTPSEICITAGKPGEYNGALIYKTENSYAGVGLWINVKINGNKNITDGFGSITGDYVNTNKDSNISSHNKTAYFLSSISIVLLIIFIILLVFYKKVNHSKNTEHLQPI